MDEINGDAPFFYIKYIKAETDAETDAYTLVDGFIYGLFGDDSTTLRINGDYPSGNFLYKGTLTSGDLSLDVSVKLKVK